MSPRVEGADRVQEKRVRRMASRQGLQVVKSRRRDPRATDFGTYILTDPATNTIVAGDHNNGFGLTLDEIERKLTS